MAKIVNYKLVYSDDWDSLEKEVNHHINKGWQPYHALHTFEVKDMEYGEVTSWFMQAMVVYESDGPEILSEGNP